MRVWRVCCDLVFLLECARFVFLHPGNSRLCLRLNHGLNTNEKPLWSSLNVNLTMPNVYQVFEQTEWRLEEADINTNHRGSLGRVLPRVHLAIWASKLHNSVRRWSSPRLWITTWLKTSKVINCPCYPLRCDGFYLACDCEHCCELCTNMQCNVLWVRSWWSRSRQPACQCACVYVRALTCYDW